MPIEKSVQWRDIGERAFWTFIAAFCAALVGPGVADLVGFTYELSAVQAAFGSGVTALVTFVLAIARWRLSILPEPGRAVIEATAREVQK